MSLALGVVGEALPVDDDAGFITASIFPINGGIPGGWTTEADDFIRAVMADMMDKQQGLPKP